MTRRLNILKTIIPAILAIAGISSCQQRDAVYRYCSLPAEGWESSQTLTYPIESLPQSGCFQLHIHLRTSTVEAYPYRKLWLEVRQHWQQPAIMRTDTLVCQLASEEGHPIGQGVSLYQYAFPLDTIRLPQGAKGRIAIRHIMQSPLLPGVSEVGLRLENIAPL